MTTAVEETEFDTETGMPVLPEGLYWEVAPRQISYYVYNDETKRHDTEWKDSHTDFEVLIRSDHTKTREWEEYETVDVVEAYKTFWGKTKNRTVKDVRKVRKTEEETQSTTHARGHLWVEKTTYKEEEYEELLKAGYESTGGGSNDGSYGQEPYRYWEMRKVLPLSDENVKDAALLALETYRESEKRRLEWEAVEAARKANVDRLVGKYPPKKLEGK